MSLIITETETMPSMTPPVERDYVNEGHQRFQTLAYRSHMSSGKRGLPAKHTPNKKQYDYNQDDCERRHIVLFANLAPPLVPILWL
jgi:hypothetical protein